MNEVQVLYQMQGYLNNGDNNNDENIKFNVTSII